jgi:hypothetical protein
MMLQKMTFRRGLFRLWVFLSVLWIGGIGFIQFSEFENYPVQGPAEKTNNSPPLITWQEATQPPPPSNLAPFDPFANACQKLGVTCSAPNATNQGQEPNIFNASLNFWGLTITFMLIPPLCILVLFLLIEWVVNGFFEGRHTS